MALMYVYNFSHLCSCLRGTKDYFIPSVEKYLQLPVLLVISMEFKALSRSSLKLWKNKQKQNCRRGEENWGKGSEET